MTALNATAKETLRSYGVSQAALARRYFTDGRWHGDACGCPDDRCIGYHHDGPADCGCLPAVLDEIRAERQAARRASGPFDTEREARELPEVRAVYTAFDADPGAGKMAPHSRRLLVQALEAAGVELGAYDERIAAWLAGWEPHTVAVIASWVIRAAARDRKGGPR